MKNYPIVLTPSLLVAIAFPFMLVLAPNGIPFVHAVCVTSGVNGTINNLTVNGCTSCNAVYPSSDQITIQCGSLTKSPTTCAISCLLTVSISTSDSCKADWQRFCDQDFFQPCQDTPVTALVGPASSTLIGFSNQCDGDGERLAIQLVPNANCGCNVPTGGGAMFDGSGDCDI